MDNQQSKLLYSLSAAYRNKLLDADEYFKQIVSIMGYSSAYSYKLNVDSLTIMFFKRFPIESLNIESLLKETSEFVNQKNNSNSNIEKSNSLVSNENKTAPVVSAPSKSTQITSTSIKTSSIENFSSSIVPNIENSTLICPIENSSNSIVPNIVKSTLSSPIENSSNSVTPNKSSTNSNSKSNSQKSNIPTQSANSASRVRVKKSSCNSSVGKQTGPRSKSKRNRIKIHIVPTSLPPIIEIIENENEENMAELESNSQKTNESNSTIANRNRTKYQEKVLLALNMVKDSFPKTFKKLIK